MHHASSLARETYHVMFPMRCDDALCIYHVVVNRISVSSVIVFI